MSSGLSRACGIGWVFLLACLAATQSAAQSSDSSRRDAAISKQGMVATVNPHATDVAVQVLRDGGNALDAAVAAALMLGVVDAHNSGLGGGCFILMHRADGQLIAIDGRETAPANAARDMFIVDGQARTDLSQHGPLAVATPGALAAYALALQQHGTRPLSDLIRPAAEMAERGFAADEAFVRNVRSTAEILALYEGSRAALLKPDGSQYKLGESVRFPELARTYRAIEKFGPSWFYRGEFAERVGTWMASHGGVLSAADFARYDAKPREPVITKYRDYVILGFPPPSSGGIHVGQILNILEHFNLKAIHKEDPAAVVHLAAEAMKLAFADRAYWLGDADFSPVPRGLTDEEFCKALAGRINPAQAIRVAGHHLPPNWESDVFEKHTTHIAAADQDGNWVGITATVNTTFGSKVSVPGTGVMLNNEMDDFSVRPGTPNAFGLVGAENNAIAPGKRPLSSMSPTIVLKDGRPVLTLGAAGGPKIITQVAMTIVRYLDLEMPLPAAVAEPRFHHQWLPDRLRLERSFPTVLLNPLQARGHRPEMLDSIAVLQAIAQPEEDGYFVGVHDPRVQGKAAGP